MTLILDEPADREYKPGDRITGRYESMSSSDDRLEVSITLKAKAVTVLRTAITNEILRTGVLPLLSKTIGTTRLADTGEGLKVWRFEMPVPRMMSSFQVAGGASTLGGDWEEDSPFPSSSLQHRLPLPPTFNAERVHFSERKLITRVIYYIRANLQRHGPMEQLEPIEREVLFVPFTRHTDADGGIQVMDSEVEIRSSRLLSSGDPEIMRNPSTGLRSTFKHLTTPKLCLEVRTCCVRETELRESFPVRVIFRRVPEKSNITKAPPILIERVRIGLHSLTWLRFSEAFGALETNLAEKTVFSQMIVLDKEVEETCTTHVDLPSRQLVQTFKLPNVVHTYRITIEWTFCCANERISSEKTMPLIIKPLQVESSAGPAPYHPHQHEAPPPSYEDATR